jgi:hypothetical protein
MGSIEDEFEAVLAGQDGPPEVELLPVRLARACAAVLPVAGAGLSALAHPGLRLPIGSSDDVAAYAERLQFTYGEGPCLFAYASGRPQLIIESDLQRAWPELHRELRSVTPFRSVVALPLYEPATRTRIGALDLYLSTPSTLEPEQLTDALLVADRMGQILSGTGLYNAAAQQQIAFRVRQGHPDPLARRIQVWKAMGLLNLHLLVTAPDALALLRARAYATDQLVDDVAHDIVTQRIALEELRP